MTFAKVADTVDSVNVTLEANAPNATIAYATSTGSFDEATTTKTWTLKANAENILTITLTSNDGEHKSVYTVKLQGKTTYHKVTVSPDTHSTIRLYDEKNAEIIDTTHIARNTEVTITLTPSEYYKATKLVIDETEYTIANDDGTSETVITKKVSIIKDITVSGECTEMQKYAVTITDPVAGKIEVMNGVNKVAR